MNKLNEISIRQYLANMNIYPVKDYGYYGMYHCPFRNDHNASFKVDYNKNVWYDFGTNKGGTMIDLVMKMENYSFHEAAIKLEREYAINSDLFSFRGNTIFNEKKDESPTTIQNIIPITYPKLIAWVQERKINLDLANRYCREVHYRNRGKDFFSIGYRNNRGGYELCGPPNFKGCYPPKDIKTYRNDNDTCLVFEGFWDFLSYLTLRKMDKTEHDVAVLNSVANVQKAMAFLKKHREIHTYLDNDDAGRKATELIKSVCQLVNDCSEKYAGYKDLNDYLNCTKQPSTVKTKRGFKM